MFLGVATRKLAASACVCKRADLEAEAAAVSLFVLVVQCMPFLPKLFGSLGFLTDNYPLLITCSLTSLILALSYTVKRVDNRGYRYVSNP